VARIGPKEKDVLATLRETVRDDTCHMSLRLAACWALSELGSDVRTTIADLLKLLGAHPVPKGRQSDSKREQLLQDIHYAFRNAREASRSRDHWGRSSGELHVVILLALGRLGPEAKEAVPRLEHIVRDRDADRVIRWCAAWALGQVGPAARSATGALAAVLQTPDEPTALRERAGQSLTQIGPDAVADLVKVVEGKDWAGRLMALEALGALGPRAKAALPALRALGRGDDVLLARAAAMAVRHIEPDADRGR
jgi:hypothetical protein